MTLPLVAPFRHSSSRERDQKWASPVRSVASRAAALAHASMRTLPSSASCTMTGSSASVAGQVRSRIGQPSHAATSSAPTGSAGRTHRDATRRELGLERWDGGDLVVQERGEEGRLGAAIGQDLDHVGAAPRPTRGDDGHPDRIGHGARQLDVVAAARPVAIDAGQEHLAGPALDGLDRPVAGVALGRLRGGDSVDLPAIAGAGRVDGHDHGLRPELRGDPADEFRVAQRRAVEADLVRARVEQGGGIVVRRHPTADGERHVERGGGTADEVEHRGASVPRGRDVEDDDLVGAVGRVPGGELDRIARVAEIHEARSLHDAAVSNVEAGEQAFRERHPQVTPARASPAAMSASPMSSEPSTSARPDHRSIDARRCQRPQLVRRGDPAGGHQARPGERPPHFAQQLHVRTASRAVTGYISNDITR